MPRSLSERDVLSGVEHGKVNEYERYRRMGSLFHHLGHSFGIDTPVVSYY